LSPHCAAREGFTACAQRAGWTVAPNGRFAYLITETTATIGTYAVDPPSGTLKELQFVDTNDYKEQPAASDIHVTPDGRFLYGAERKTIC
jgi:6-phosphogluconolactonase